MAMQLGDDGTMDTVIVCSECGAEMRYNFDDDNEPRGEDSSAAYDRFVSWAMADAREDHECPKYGPHQTPYWMATHDGDCAVFNNATCNCSAETDPSRWIA